METAVTEPAPIARNGEKHTVLVSRLQGNPAISIDITQAGIFIGLALDDFLTDLLDRVGSPVGIFTKAQLEAKLRAAADATVYAMKAETGRVAEG